MKDYKNLLDENPKARAILEENRAFLAGKKATYDGLPIGVKALHRLLMSSESGNVVALLGPAGVGKSYATRIMADHDGAPLMVVQCGPDTTKEDLFGTFLPNESKEAGGAAWRFVPGPVLTAASEGWELVLDEFSNLRPEVAAEFYKIFDDSKIFDHNGRIYQKSPNFRAYITGNPGYRGSSELQEAIKNRLIGCYIWPADDEASFAKKLQIYWKGLPNKFYRHLFKAMKVLQEKAESPEFREKIEFSQRQGHYIADGIKALAEEGGLDKTAFEAVFSSVLTNMLSCDNDNVAKIPGVAEAMRGNLDALWELIPAELKTAPAAVEGAPEKEADLSPEEEKDLAEEFDEGTFASDLDAILKMGE